ncbi:MAG TPA: helix-turn-helix transcriptional regulator [Candidatus Baltobacteraceae bacterium]|nr:helix-turn-helix transcriptional regulator [Candidatus Baltobacteraceae bacterium]
MSHIDAYDQLFAQPKPTEVPRPRRRPSSQLTILLRHFRWRIDPKIAALGPYRRLPSRRGKPVTQEELAEYLGVSRTWYGLLESKKPVRASLVLLDRLSAALMLTREERAKLFASALPELDFPFAR